MDDTLQYVWDSAEMRMHGDGVFAPDLLKLKSSIHVWGEWLDAWVNLAKEYEQLAGEALENGFQITAGEHYWQSSISLHYGQFLWFHHPGEKRRAQERKVEMYRKAAPLLSPPAERVDIPFEGTRIPAYLRLPPTRAVFPCVILIGGLESTKEESYHFENACLQRGLATMVFDGPGQGEYYYQRPLVNDFERYTSAVADYIETRDDIDRDKLAILGRSLGGYYVIRSCVLDDRFKACVAFGALYDLSHFDSLHPLVQQGFRHITGISDPNKAESTVKGLINLDDVAHRLRTPFYLMHGELDPLIPVSHARKLAATAASAQKTVAIEPHGTHCAHNLHHRVRRPMIDWTVAQLGGAVPSDQGGSWPR